MRSTATRLSFIAICFAAVLLAAAGYADRVYKVGASKGMPILQVESTITEFTTARPIYEVHLFATRGRFRAFRAPAGWDVGFNPTCGDRGVIWSTDSAPVPIGEFLDGFMLKKSGGGDVSWQTGGGDVSWQTYDGESKQIDWGWVKLKGR